MCNIVSYFTFFFSLGKGSHHHQNRYDEHKRCHPHYRQSFDARNRRAGRTSRSVNGDVHFFFLSFFLARHTLIRIFRLFQFLLTFHAFFVQLLPTISLGSTNSIPLFSEYLVQRWKAFIPS